MFMFFLIVLNHFPAFFTKFTTVGKLMYINGCAQHQKIINICVDFPVITSQTKKSKEIYAVWKSQNATQASCDILQLLDDDNLIINFSNITMISVGSYHNYLATFWHLTLLQKDPHLTEIDKIYPKTIHTRFDSRKQWCLVNI